MGVTRTVFAAMVREEWRLHADLFGGRRFAAFPLVVLAVGAATVAALVETGTPAGQVVAGFHALVFVFGLHTGSLGFVGRDALRGVLEEMTLIISSARTLPISQRRLFAVFLVKDACYYAALFLLPLSLAFAPALSLARLPLLWLSTAVTFTFGVVVTFAAIALSTRGLSGRLLLLGAAAALGLGWAAGLDPVGATPYALYAAPLSTGAAVAVLAVPALGAFGVLAFDTSYVRPARTGENGFGRWQNRLPGGDPLVAKSLLDVARSGGGFGKVLFSAGVLFAVSAGLVGLVESITGVEPSFPVSLGAILGLTGFTTYNWLTQFDGPDTYATLPVSTAAVFQAKFRAFLVLGPPAALGFYALAAAWRGGAAGELLAGAALVVGFVVYLFGLTVALSGLRPNEFLFDTALFAAFGLGVAVPLVPVLVVGFVLAPYEVATLGALVAVGVAAAAAGVFLYRRGIPRWERRYREG
ncbi:MAG: hypothetical protein ABEJ68_09820 [Halobacteriaceae archaeon]